MAAAERKKDWAFDKGWVAQVLITLVLVGFAAWDQATTDSIDKWLIGGIVFMGLKLGGENIAELIRAWKGG